MDTEKAKAIVGTVEDIIKVVVPADVGATAVVPADAHVDPSAAAVTMAEAGDVTLPNGRNVRSWNPTWLSWKKNSRQSKKSSKNSPKNPFL